MSHNLTHDEILGKPARVQRITLTDLLVLYLEGMRANPFLGIFLADQQLQRIKRMNEPARKDGQITKGEKHHGTINSDSEGG